MELICSIKLTQPPLQFLLFHDPHPSSDADIICGGSLSLVSRPAEPDLAAWGLPGCAGKEWFEVGRTLRIIGKGSCRRWRNNEVLPSCYRRSFVPTPFRANDHRRADCIDGGLRKIPFVFVSSTFMIFCIPYFLWSHNLTILNKFVAYGSEMKARNCSISLLWEHPLMTMHWDLIYSTKFISTSLTISMTRSPSDADIISGGPLTTVLIDSVHISVSALLDGPPCLWFLIRGAFHARGRRLIQSQESPPHLPEGIARGR